MAGMYLQAGDTLNGVEGEVLINIGGNIFNGGYVTDLEATIDKRKKDVPVLGYRGMQYKATGWAGNGKATLYHVTSRFTKLMEDYIKTGRDAYFDMVVTVYDPNSNAGTHRVRLGKCNISSDVAAVIKVEDEVLKKEFEFTFSEFDLLNQFNEVL